MKNLLKKVAISFSIGCFSLAGLAGCTSSETHTAAVPAMTVANLWSYETKLKNSFDEITGISEDFGKLIEVNIDEISETGICNFAGTKEYEELGQRIEDFSNQNAEIVSEFPYEELRESNETLTKISDKFSLMHDKLGVEDHIYEVSDYFEESSTAIIDHIFDLQRSFYSSAIAFLEENKPDDNRIEEFKSTLDNVPSSYNTWASANSGTASDSINSSKSSNSSSNSKICQKSGCFNNQVTTGDSVYCAEHSNKCLNCRSYIDGDAMYCMNCLSGSVSSKSNSSSSSSSSSKGSCGYKYSNGSICGRPLNNYSGLCDTHKRELDNVYNSLVGN